MRLHVELSVSEGYGSTLFSVSICSAAEMAGFCMGIKGSHKLDCER